MRRIDYIFIDTDTQDVNSQSGRPAVPNFGYHYVVTDNQFTNPTDIQLIARIIPGPIYDPDKYNRHSIFIRSCGSLRTEPCLQEQTPESCPLNQRAALLHLLSSLRKRFPDAKILGVSELDAKALHSKNIIVSDAMNQLRRTLSDLS